MPGMCFKLGNSYCVPFTQLTNVITTREIRKINHGTRQIIGIFSKFELRNKISL